MSRLVRIKTLSAYLDGVSPHTIRKLAQAGKIPHHRLNGSSRGELFFCLDEIDAALKGPANGEASEQPSREELAG